MFFKRFNDAYYLVLFVLGAISLLALTTPSFSRNIFQLFLILSSVFFFDYVLSFLIGKNNFNPLSSIISGLGIFFLFESIYTYLYVLVAFIAIASKYVLRINNRHIFNPTNLALLLVAFGLSDSSTVNVFRWQVWGTQWSLFFIIVGVYILRRVDRWVMALTFCVSFFLFAAFKSFVFNIKVMSLLLPLTGAPLHLFMFFMLTDPKTTPGPRSQQLLFSLSVAFLDSIFRFYENRLGLLTSLIMVSLAYSLYDYYQARFRVGVVV